MTFNWHNDPGFGMISPASNLREGDSLQTYMEAPAERVLLAGCQLPPQTDEQFSCSIMELAALAETAGGEVVAKVTQKRDRIDSAAYFGKGKIEEIADATKTNEIDTVIVNDELSARQNNQLTERLEVHVIDRTQLILDIFASRAHSREGKLQVELAQLKYLLPMLTGQGTSLSRLGAGIGTRGPGETKLEQDRRHIRRRIADLSGQMDAVVSHRERYRERRKQNRRFQISLVGYTNAGKSTLLNQLTAADTLQENQLFATLDPLTRKLRLPSGITVLLTDTVGFIQELPTSLIAAFRSTLEEVKEADLILHIVDASHPDFIQQENTVLSLLAELGADTIPVVTVYNKMDRLQQTFIPSPGTDAIQISAMKHEDILRLQEKTEEAVKEDMVYYDISVPAEDGRLLAQLQEDSLVDEKGMKEDKQSMRVKGYIFADQPLYETIRQYE